MPLVKINIIEGRTVIEKHGIVECVHKALVGAFKIKDDDKCFRIIEFKREDFVIPPTKTDKYILIEILIFPGRSLDAKRLLYGKIVDNLKQIGIEAGDIFILLQEEPLDNCGIRGGYPASEIDLGFNLKV